MTPMPGDADGDGDVDIDDFAWMKRNMHAPATGESVKGDFDGDSDVDMDDFSVFKQVFGTNMATQVIMDDPETSRNYTAFYGALWSFDGVPRPTDAIQGNLADCYFIATLAAYAAADPDHIRRSIGSNGDDTYWVRMYDVMGRIVLLRIDADLPTRGDKSLVYAQITVAMWVALLEKAYAEMRYGTNDYGDLPWGWPEDAAQTLSGQPATSYWVTAVGAEWVVEQVSLGRPVTVITIDGSHALAIIGVDDEAETVQIYDPYGSTSTWAISDLDIGFGIVTVSD